MKTMRSVLNRIDAVGLAVGSSFASEIARSGLPTRITFEGLKTPLIFSA
jgi:hypothetical protein